MIGMYVIMYIIIRQYKLILNLYESTVPISHVIVQYVTLTDDNISLVG